MKHAILLPALATMLLPLFVFAEQTNGTISSSVAFPQVECPAEPDSMNTTSTTVPATDPVPQNQTGDWFWLGDIAIPLFAAFGAALLTHWFACRQESRSCRKVAWVILDGLRREVEEGIEVLKRISPGILSGNDSVFTPMPTVFWETHSRSLNGRVLEAACRAAEKNGVGKSGPPPKEFLVRTTNHYQVTCANVNCFGRDKILSSFGKQELDQAICDSSELLSLLTDLCKSLDDAR